MITVTKIFRFEAAHVIDGYPGLCGQLHGHSYELHVTVGSTSESEDYVPGLGILYDFRDLKKLVQKEVIEPLDHKTIVSAHYLAHHPFDGQSADVMVMAAEPTVENLLVWISARLRPCFSGEVRLAGLKLYETRDSYAGWS